MGRPGLLYAELSRANALARNLAHLAAMRKSKAALRGTISAVLMAENLQFLRPTVCPIHWALTAGAGRAYHSERGEQVWGTLGMLRATATAVRTQTDLPVLALCLQCLSRCAGRGGCQHPQSGHQPAKLDVLLRPQDQEAMDSRQAGNPGGAVATGPAGVRDRIAQSLIPATLLPGRTRVPHALLTVGFTMGRSRLALFEAALSSRHGRTGSPHLRRVHLELMDIAAAGIGVRSIGQRVKAGVQARPRLAIT